MSKKQKQPKTLLQVNLDRKRFLKQLKQAAPATAKGSLLPVLQSVKIEAGGDVIAVAATNLDVYLQAVAVAVDETAAHVIEQPGEALLPLKPLLDVFGSWAEDRVVLTVVEAAYEEGKLLPAEDRTVDLLRSEKAEADIRADISLLDWPQMAIEEPASLTLTGAEVIAAFDDVLFCAAGDESRPILTGVYTIIKQRELTAVTADGFRLGHKVIPLGAGVPAEFAWSAVIPANSLRMLLKLIDDPEAPVLVAFDQSREPGRVKFSGERFTFITHLLAGQYPNFEQIIPKPDSNDCVTVASLDEFKKGVHTITPYVDKVRWVKMEHGQPVKLFASRIDVGQSEVEIPTLSSEGGTCPHAFNVDYLLPLSTRAGEKITFRNRPDSESDPMVITIDETVKYVIMPMHLSR